VQDLDPSAEPRELSRQALGRPAADLDLDVFAGVLAD
jgi:hypothetical protein